MSVICQDRIQAISELVQSGRYQVDPLAVAEAMIRQIVWEDVPEMTAAAAVGSPGQAPRLRGVIRVRQLVSAPHPPRAA